MEHTFALWYNIYKYRNVGERVFAMAKGTPTYVLNLKLETEPFQDHIFDKRFEIGRKLYNSVLNVAQKRYCEMVKTKSWRENQKNIADIYNSEKDHNKAEVLCRPYFKIRKDLLKKHGCTNTRFMKLLKLCSITIRKTWIPTPARR